MDQEFNAASEERMIVGTLSIVSISRYFKIARQRFAIDDTKVLVRCIQHQTHSNMLVKYLADKNSRAY